MTGPSPGHPTGTRRRYAADRHAADRGTEGDRDFGVLIVNLGSPDSTSVPDVRRYLKEFLLDPRVIDAPAPIRHFIVRGLILPFRPKRSAHAYRQIWWNEGSPLVAITRRVRDRLRERLAFPVEMAMRYGNPSIRSGLSSLLDRGARDILLIPLYPHYAMATVETVVEKAREDLSGLTRPRRGAPDGQRWRHGRHASLRVLPPFYDNPDYIDALVESAAPHLAGGFDRLVISYHGVPERHVRKTDPTNAHCLASPDCCESPSSAHARCYRHQVFDATRRFAERAGLPDDKVVVTFQSRLGRDKWLSPYTDATLSALPAKGARRVAVMCPAFVSDCLETLEEVGIHGREHFLAAGGESFELIPCLNDHTRWIDALEGWCRAAASDRSG